MFDSIEHGNPLVLVEKEPAAGLSHRMAHGGKVVTGCANVFIGEPALGPDGKLLPVPTACEYLVKGLQSVATGGAPAEGLAALRDRFKLSRGQGAAHVFQDLVGPVPVREYEVVIRGHKIKIIEPVPAARAPGGGLLLGNGTWLPDAPMAASALATLSDEQLARIHTVVLSPNAYFDPDDPGRDDTANCGGGVMTYFPRNQPHPQSDIDWVAAHESAHAVTAGLGWTTDPNLPKPASQRAWEDAIWKDGRKVSAYGTTSVLEDFAEAVILYAMTKGTPCEATARALFPNRYAEMEKLFPNGYRPRGKKP
jgi:hypothetical protein